MAASEDTRIGSELAGYRIESVVGRGGMGVVYRARDLALDRDVALKLLSPELAEDGRFRERFLIESRLAAAIDHPNIIPIYDAGEIAGELYLAMRYVDGSDLKQLLAHGPLPRERAITIAGQVAGALDAAHERGLVHRDVKPSNVLLDERGHVYLADFGLSRRLGESGAALGATQSLGTIAYVAPEQIRGEAVDGRADLYSLGCLLYECISGRPPFPRPTDAAVLFAHLEDAPPAVAGLEDVMPIALAKAAGDRFQTGSELIEAARRGLGLQPRRIGWPAVAAVSGTTLIAAALVAFVLVRGGSGAGRDPAADLLVRIDPGTNKVTETLPVGRSASAVAAGNGRVWVTSFRDGNVWRVDPRSKAVLRVATRGSPTDVAVTRGEVLVANGPEQSLTGLDEASGDVRFVDSLGAGDNIGSLRVTAGDGALWFADPTGRVAGRIDPELHSGKADRQIRIPPDATALTQAYESIDGVAFGAGSLWVAGDALGRQLWRLDPATRRVLAVVALPFVPAGLAAGPDAVWVTSLLDDTVVRIDPATDRIVTSVRVGRGASSLAVEGGTVWVVNAIDGTVSRVDALTNTVVATIPVGHDPGDIAVGSGSVWVTARQRSAVAAVRQNAIVVGVLSDCRGRYSWTRDSTVLGSKLALIERGGSQDGPALTADVDGVSIGGRPIQLVFGCSDTTTGSALSEARRLVDEVGARVLIGPLGGNQGLALQSFARRRPGVAFVNGTSSAQLLRPAPNFFSFHTDGAGWTAGLGTYAFRSLGWRSAVVVADLQDDVFNWTQAAGFIAEFCSLGGTISKRIWVPAGTQDYSLIMRKVPARVDGFFFAAYPKNTIIAFARSLPGLRGNISGKLIAGAFADLGELGVLGARIRGLVGGGAGGSGDWDGYLRRFRRAFPTRADQGGGYFDIFYHDATAATLAALTAVDGDLSGGERRFMSALAHLRLVSPLGPITLDRDRQAVANNTLYRDGTAFRTIPRVDHTFGGYFKAGDPAPSEATPACVKRTPPSWSR